MAKKAGKKKVVRVAFIGAGGRSASVHYPSIRDLPDAEIAAMCDLNEELLNKRGDQFGVKARYTNYKEMVEKDIPTAEADERLVRLIREHGRWVDPPARDA